MEARHIDYSVLAGGDGINDTFFKADR